MKCVKRCTLFYLVQPRNHCKKPKPFKKKTITKTNLTTQTESRGFRYVTLGVTAMTVHKCVFVNLGVVVQRRATLFIFIDKTINP